MASVPHNARVIRLPASEVCLHMKVTDRIMYASDVGHGMVQLHEGGLGDLRNFSAPITKGEAGWDQQWVQLADDFGTQEDRKAQREALPVRYVAYTKDRDGEWSEEFDLDCNRHASKKAIREFVEGVILLDYDPDAGLKVESIEEKFGMYL